MLTQAMLGFVPDAPRNKLYVDPSLPSWLPDVTVKDFGLGKHKIDIRFGREGEQRAIKVIKGDPELVKGCNCRAKDRLRADLTDGEPCLKRRSRRDAPHCQRFVVVVRTWSP